MDTEYETNPLNVKDKLQFEKLAEELLNIYGNDKGNLMIVEQGRRILDRTLIDDIEKYKIDAKVKMMFKSMRS